MSLVLDLTALVSEVLTAGAFMSLNIARYRSEYRAAPKPKKVVLDTAYGLCFRACVVHFLQVMQEEIGPRGTGKLNVVLEGGHRHVRDADRIFAEMQASIRVHFGVDTLGILTTAAKDCPLLMSADFLAHTMYMRDREAQDEAPLTSPAMAARLSELRGRLTELQIDPGAMADLSEHFGHLKRERRSTKRVQMP